MLYRYLLAPWLYQPLLGLTLFFTCDALAQAADKEDLIKRAATDQQIRQRLAKTAGRDSVVLKEMIIGDSLNSIYLYDLLAGRAWFDTTELNPLQMKAAFTLLQHCTSLETQEQALPHIQALVEEGKLSRLDYVTLIDRTLVLRDKPQHYGTQLHEVNNEIVAYPCEDPKNVDARRKTIGLPPLQSFIEMANRFHRAQRK